MNKEDKLIYKTIKKQFDSILDIFESETFMASIYLLKYFESDDIKYYNTFLEKMNKFTIEEKKQVLLNVVNNLKEQNKNKNKKHNKVKVKNKDE